MASLVWRADRLRWYAYYQADGKRAGRAIMDAPRRKDLTRRERALAQASAEGIEEDNRAVPVDAIDIETGAAYWLKDCRATLSNRTCLRYRTTVQGFLTAIGADDKRVSMRSISQQHVRDYRDARLDDGKRGRTVVNDIKCLGAMFNWLRKQRDPATGERWIVENPCEDVRRPAVEPREVIFPETKEVLAMLAALGCECYEFQALGILGAYCGMRRNEIVRLRWRDVDFDAGLIRVHVSKSKNARPVPMNDIVRRLLQDVPRVDDVRVFPPGRDECQENLHNPSIARSFNRWLKNQGIEWTHHSLRRWFVNELRQHPELSTAARLLIVGHEDEATNRLYQNPQAEEARPIVDALPLPGRGNQDAPTAQVSQPQVPAKHGRTPDMREA